MNRNTLFYVFQFCSCYAVSLGVVITTYKSNALIHAPTTSRYNLYVYVQCSTRILIKRTRFNCITVFHGQLIDTVSWAHAYTRLRSVSVVQWITLPLLWMNEPQQNWCFSIIEYSRKMCQLQKKESCKVYILSNTTVQWTCRPAARQDRIFF